MISVDQGNLLIGLKINTNIIRTILVIPKMSQKKSILQLLYSRQIQRYKKKGLKNCIIAIALLLLVIIGGTQLGRHIWPQNIQNPQQFTVITTLMIHFIFQVLYFLMFLPGYMGHPAYQKYAINKKMKKPWERENWPQMKWRTAFYLFMNKGIVFPALIYASIKLGGTKTRFIDFPTPLQVFTQLLFVIMVQDFFFFWAHKLSHDFNFLYKYHKIHHEYDFVISLAAEYTHPIDYVLGVLIPSAMPFVLLGSRAHCFMLMFWQVWKIFVSSEGHCGFEFPFSPTRILPLVSGASYHDFHHSKNVGNFAGSVYLWDTIMGTNHVYFDRLNQDEVRQKEQ